MPVVMGVMYRKTIAFVPPYAGIISASKRFISQLLKVYKQC